MSAKSIVEKDEFFKKLKGYKQSIWPIIEEYITPKPIPSISSLEMPKIETFFWKQIADYPKRGGKFIRSSLILMTCEALGGSCEDALMTAAAMEICQNWALVHDDIEDKSTKRRGKPTLHIRYSIDHAINAGDGLHVMMWRILSKNLERLDIEKCSLIWDEFYDMLIRTVVGQTADLTLRDSLDLTIEDIYYILDGKTGYYTIAGPMRLGAVIAGYDPRKDTDLFQDINEFGLNLGRSFQIIDDLLDITSDFEGLKEQGNDIQEGKRSVMLVKLIQEADQFDLPRVFDIMNKPRGTRSSDEISFIITLMHEYGIIDETRTMAQELADKSRQIMKKLPFKEDSAKVFDKFVQYLVERTY
ncbi:MAG: polyprenyl synthetase family protein [Candidatus Hodarchaeales archaeon]|jgi:geranylgeranyl diphosphate synthase type II